MDPNRRKRIIKAGIAAFVALLANMLFLLTQWLATRYDRISLEQILYQMQTSITGVSKKLTSSISIRVGVFGLLMTIGQVAVYLVLSGHGKKFLKFLKKMQGYTKYCTTKACKFFARRALPIALVFLLCSVAVFGIRLEVFSYVGNTVDETDFIETHYVDPRDVELKFPEQKRNLIFIFLESMENTFTDPESCETVAANYIPRLTQYAEENVNFSHQEGAIGGAQSLEGTTWTAAALVAQTSGVTIKVPLTGHDYGEEEYYMPGIVALGDILEEQGYRQVVLFGSKGAFANRDAY